MFKKGLLVIMDKPEIGSANDWSARTKLQIETAIKNADKIQLENIKYLIEAVYKDGFKDGLSLANWLTDTQF